MLGVSQIILCINDLKLTVTQSETEEIKFSGLVIFADVMFLLASNSDLMCEMCILEHHVVNLSCA